MTPGHALMAFAWGSRDQITCFPYAKCGCVGATRWVALRRIWVRPLGDPAGRPYTSMILCGCKPNHVILVLPHFDVVGEPRVKQLNERNAIGGFWHAVIR